jgi:hypothetical protein
VILGCSYMKEGMRTSVEGILLVCTFDVLCCCENRTFMMITFGSHFCGTLMYLMVYDDGI